MSQCLKTERDWALETDRFNPLLTPLLVNYHIELSLLLRVVTPSAQHNANTQSQLLGPACLIRSHCDSTQQGRISDRWLSE